MKRLLFLILLLAASQCFAQKTYIQCGKLIDGNSDTEQSQMTIVVDGKLITDIQKGYTSGGAADKVIDLRDKTVMPHGAEGIRRAILGGVTSIEHGSFMDDEDIRLMKQYGIWYVPTLIAGHSVADSAKIPGYFPPVIARKAIEVSSKMQGTFARAYKAGVKIAFGTDAGVYDHGKNAIEFQYMVDGGMPPMEAIKCATVHAADLLGLSDITGSITKGKSADIVAVNGDPLQDIKALQQMVFVMKEGAEYK